MDKFIFNTDCLVEYYADLKEKPINSLTLSSLKARDVELKDLWAEVKSAYENCVCDLENPLELDNLSAVKAKYRLSSETYFMCSEFIINCLDKIKATISEAKSSSDENPGSSDLQAINQGQKVSVSKDSNQNGFKLPPCDCELFQGDYLSWPSFRDMFLAVYGSHSRLSPVQKLFHLRAKTRGDALSIVSKFALTDNNFEIAWEALSSQFENKRILVNSHLKILFNLPNLSVETDKGLKQLHRDVNECLCALKSHGIETESWDSILTFLVSNRLPEKTLSLWEQGLTNPSEIPTWKDMSAFLVARYKTLETINDIQLCTKSMKSVSSSQPHANRKVSAHLTKPSKTTCVMCQGTHSLRLCPTFLQMEIKDRVQTVRSNNLCSNCLAPYHTSQMCKSKFTCSYCKKRHHTLIHFQDSVVPQQHNPSNSSHIHFNVRSNELQSTPQHSFTNVNTHLSTSSKQILLATALVSIKIHGINHTLRALIDPGSEVTLISKAAQRRLGLPVTQAHVQISGVNQAVTTIAKSLCRFSMGSNLNSSLVNVHALVVERPTGHLPSKSAEYLDLSKLSGFKLADPQFYKSSAVDMLIGADVYSEIIQEGVHHNLLGKLVLQNTIFGWIISGPLPKPSTPVYTTVVSYFNQVSLDEEIRRFWELEEVANTKILSYEDEYCEQLYSDSTYRQPDGRYVVKLPFSTEFHQTVELGFSRRTSEKRLMLLESQLAKDPSLQSEYSEVIEEYLKVGHMKTVPPKELSENNKVVSYYMPHHAVVKPESSTTKVRVVFNASSLSQNGTSLNDVLYTGPVLQQDLVQLILKWRKYRYVLNADITKMYRQIRVHEQHTPFQRILFRTSPSEPLQDFELQTVTFGVKCSPYLAIRTLLQLADDEQLKYPIGASLLRNNFYVDDLLAGFDSLEQAQTAQSEIKAILSTAGFQLRKWTANNSKLLRNTPTDQILNDPFKTISEQNSIKTLGIYWNPKSDSFHFKIEPIPFSTNCTKREVFSLVAKLFDPAGWTAPVLIKAKILLQTIWKDKTQWDQQLTTSSLAIWKRFTETFTELSQLQIPRWVEITPETKIQIHGFCDSSERAYTAAIFVRVEDSSRGITSHILCSKTKVAPVNPVTLPRLELCGAVLLAKLMGNVLPMFNSESPEIHLWSDSSIVLAWLAKPPSTWRTFVANRCSKIKKYVDEVDWKPVSSEDNPADLATRGIAPNELISNRLWWNGPKWLCYPENLWPATTPAFVGELELESKAVSSFHTDANESEDILARFSCYARALRVISYVLRFFYSTNSRFKSNNFNSKIDISREEIIRTKEKLVRLAQLKHFSKEYANLQNNRRLHPKSSLLTLNPILDSKGIIRVHGRLANSNISWSERFPIILPYESTYSKLLLGFVHKITLHGGNQLMFILIRQEYWIPKVKNLIKTCVNHCKPCVLHKQDRRSQLMVALPPERSSFSRPFSKTGVDFAGPFDIKTYLGRSCRLTKGYVCVFVCFSTKAIHLEGTTELSTASFLAAFQRFIARRGLPSDIYSDNGTNFVGANRIIKENFRRHVEEIASKASKIYSSGLSWHFIPPGALHMGGLWEAGVKSFKTHFKKVGAGVKYTFEEFSTLLCRIEACLNSRPISSISENPNYPLPLTPGHFLIGGPLLSLAEPDPQDSSLSLLKRWEKLKVLQLQFCRRWKEEYLKEMHKRYKWKFPQREIEIGDIVVVKQENLPPTEWRLGRVTTVFPGTDGRVRVASIRTQNGEIKRPIVKLCVISA